MPRKPRRPSSSITGRGNVLVRSHSAACGAMCSRANSRARSTIWRWVSLNPSVGRSTTVVKEPPPALAAQAAGGHHRAQQRARPVLVVPEIAVQHLENREADVEADQIGERQRSERVIHAEL